MVRMASNQTKTSKKVQLKKPSYHLIPPRKQKKVIKYLTSSLNHVRELQKYLPGVTVTPINPEKINPKLYLSAWGSNLQNALCDLVKEAFKIYGPIIVSKTDLLLEVSDINKELTVETPSYKPRKAKLITHFYYTDDGETVQTSIGYEHVYMAQTIGVTDPNNLPTNPLYSTVGFTRERTFSDDFSVWGIMSFIIWMMACGFVIDKISNDESAIFCFMVLSVFAFLIFLVATAEKQKIVDLLSTTLRKGEFDKSFERAAIKVKNFVSPDKTLQKMMNDVLDL